jgi:hypothetical protein
MYQTKCTENQNTRFIFNNFSRKWHRLRDNVEKYGTARQTTDANIIGRRRYALCMLGNYGYRHTLRIFNTFCFSAAGMVTRTLVSVNGMRTLPVLFCHTS